jgi:PadR family transcriptional regulator, regulatory protein AphA
VAAPLTTTSHAVLGLLAIRPWTTYELAKQVQRSLGWFWPRAERKLYDEPKRLVAAGLATATVEHTGRRPRTVYAITDAGRSALRGWLDEPSAPPALEFEAMVKVFFADGGTIRQLRGNLAEIEREARARQAVLQAMADADVADGGDGPFARRRALNALALRFSIDHEDLVARWAAWASEQVAGWDPARALAAGCPGEP